MRFADLTSRATVMPAHERIDPYWSGMWNPGGTANWLSRNTVERMVDSGVMRAPAWLAKTREQACLDIARGRRSASAQRALAAIGCWRTLTVQQLATITAEPLFATNNRAEVYTNLLASSLVSEGVTKSFGHTDIPRLVRPFSGPGAHVEALTDLLDDTDAVRLTHGQPWRAGSMHDRHNMLGAELLLRIGEYTSAKLVAGEQLASISALTGNDVNRSGDGLFVLPGGGVVVVEMTATTSSNFAAKVDHWTTALARNRSLAVLWFDIAHPDQSASATSKSIRKEVRRSTSQMDAVLAGVRDRMLLASWRDWFPGAGQASPNFIALRALRPPTGGGDEWESVSMADPFEFVLPDSGSALLDNSGLMGGIPVWEQVGRASL